MGIVTIRAEIPDNCELVYDELRCPKEGESFLDFAGGVVLASCDYYSQKHIIVRRLEPLVFPSYLMKCNCAGIFWWHSHWRMMDHEPTKPVPTELEINLSFVLLSKWYPDLPKVKKDKNGIWLPKST